MGLSEFIEDERLRKKSNKFNWEYFVKAIEIALGKEQNKELQRCVSDFILITDLIDDLMDKDRESVISLLEKEQHSLSNYLIETLEKIEEIVPPNCYKKFIDCIAHALLFQNEDTKYQVSLESKESDYFNLVNKSVLLTQSIIYLVDNSPPKELLQSIKYITLSAQIENDINELEKDIPFDLLDKKGTLPLIKALEFAKETNDTKFIEGFLRLSRDNYSEKHLYEIVHYLEQSPALIYSRLLRVSFEEKARSILKKMNLESFYETLNF